MHGESRKYKVVSIQLCYCLVAITKFCGFYTDVSSFLTQWSYSKEMEYKKHIMDNVHGKIALTELEYQIINTSIFKRLKGIKQLGTVHEVFPTGEHTRFPHSLGTMHTARKWCEALQADPKDQELVEIAGLCHDLGHGPFSHLWEQFVREGNPDFQWEHEESSYKMLLLAIEENPKIKLDENDLFFIKELICGGSDIESAYPYKARGPEHFYLYEIISNKITGIDVDKFDYLARDDKALFNKSQIKFDYVRLSDSEKLLKVVEGKLFKDEKESPVVRRIAIRDKEVRSMQKIFQDRSELHQTAYQHKTVKIFDRMYVDLWLLASDYIKVSGKNGKMYTLASSCQDEVALSKLTDDWVMQSIRNSDTEDLKPARDLLRRIDQRKIYHSIAHIKVDDDGSLDLKTAEKSLEVLKENLKKLNEKDLTVVGLHINMGTKDKSNPVEKMLFYKKGSKEGYFKGREELKTLVPQQVYDKQLFVLCKTENEDLMKQAAKNVEDWDDKHAEWALIR